MTGDASSMAMKVALGTLGALASLLLVIMIDKISGHERAIAELNKGLAVLESVVDQHAHEEKR